MAYVQTRRLIPTGHGCRLGVYLGRPESPEHASEETRSMKQGYMTLCDRLGTLIEGDVAAGRVTLPAAQGA
jgi:hypothetical protein